VGGNMNSLLAEARVAGMALVCGALLISPPARATAPPPPEHYNPKTGLLDNGLSPPPPFVPGPRTPRVHPPVVGEGHAVVLLIDFPDRMADESAHPASFFDDLLFSEGTHPTGSMRDFYIEQSYGAYRPGGDVYGWFTSEYDYYTTFDDGAFGGNGGSIGVSLMAAFLADPTVDYGQYDSDGPDGIPNSGDDDGIVDQCIIYFPGLGGHDTLNPSDIWPVITFPEYVTNDARAGGGNIVVETVSIQPELSLNYPATADTLDQYIAVVAHEYGHLLGLADLYQKGPTWGIGYWGLMGYGSTGWQKTGPYHMCALSKIYLGWITPTVVTSSMTNLTIPPVETNPVVYQMWRDGDPQEEYFLVENRQQILHDQMLPGEGLLVWHVDWTMIAGQGPAPSRAPNFDFFIGLEQADGLNDMNVYFERPTRGEYYHEMGDSGDPFPGDSLNTLFDGWSWPSSDDNAGNRTGVAIRNITPIGDDIRVDLLTAPTAVYFSAFRARAVDRGVELTWDLFADEPLDGFRLYRRSSGERPYEKIAGTAEIGPLERSYVDTRALSGARYEYVLAAVRPDGSEVRSPPAAVALRERAAELFQNVPNPFNPSTRIPFYLPASERVTLTIFGADGTRVRTLLDGVEPPGLGEVRWDGRDENGNAVSSGVYFCCLWVDERLLTRKMVVVR
jgi:M6 family metalloprotease-like protein